MNKHTLHHIELKHIRSVMDGTHAIWYDNFSKIYGTKTPTFKTGAWTDCLWTGVAIHRYVGPTLSNNLHTRGGAIVPAMPESLSANMGSILLAMQSAMNFQGEYHDISLVTTMDVQCVPLKPTGGDVQLQQQLDESRDGLTNLLPHDLITENIGSNIGLMKILRQFHDDRQMHIPGRCRRYYVLNVDINIYTRTLKVIPQLFIRREMTHSILIINSQHVTYILVQFMYDKSGVGASLRKYVFVNLALWHTYKHACMHIWHTYSRELLAGLYHQLFPSGIFKRKESLSCISVILSMVRIGYPLFKPDLDRALARSDLSTDAKHFLFNLKDLYSFYIPVVSWTTQSNMYHHVTIIGAGLWRGSQIGRWQGHVAAYVPHGTCAILSQRQGLRKFCFTIHGADALPAAPRDGGLADVQEQRLCVERGEWRDFIQCVEQMLSW